MNLTLDQIDQSFHDEIQRLADRTLDQAGYAAMEGIVRRVNVDRFYEAIVDAITQVEIETPAETAHDEYWNSLGSAA